MPLQTNDEATPPSPTNLSGPAYSLGFKVIASLLVLAVTVWFGVLISQGKLAGAPNTAWFLLLAAWCLLVVTLWAIFRSQTTLEAAYIEQTWIWQKKIPYSQIAIAKWLQIKPLSWLIAPRLYTRSAGGKVTTFYVADSSLWARCAQIAADVKKPK